jgi:hypothetical protein
MVDPTDRIERALRCYREEVLRWNDSFSLVSRIEPETRLEALVAESRAAFTTLTGTILPLIGSNRDILYIDLGSGAGIPGLVWHLLAAETGFGGTRHAGSLLVEPRKKRAWFLEQTARIMQLSDLRVGEDQWGSRTALRHEGPGEKLTTVITLKALRLSDDEIIAGWRRYRRGGEGDTLVISRFRGRATNPESSRHDELHTTAKTKSADMNTTWIRTFPMDGDPSPGCLLVSCYPTL